MKAIRMSRVAALAAGIVGVCSYASPAVASPAVAAPAAVVHAGQSIQAAIDAAEPGTTVVVAAGVYRENLLITKPLTVRGAGHVVLEPPIMLAPNVCTNDPDAPAGFDVGFCILGELGPIPPGGDVPPVLSPVRDVRLEGFEVKHFTSGVIALGTSDLRISHVEADHGGDGIFTEIGENTVLDADSVHDNSGTGIDVRATSQLRVTHNSVRANQGEGLTVLDSHGGTISANTIAGNCAGITLVDTAGAGSTGDLLVSANAVHANNLFCAGDSSKPSESGIGVALLGTTHVHVVRNMITGNVGQLDPITGQPAQFGGLGFVLLDGQLAGGAAPTDNRIARNIITGNVPLDVLTDGSGSDNTFVSNTCQVANVAGICH